jgi:hypothetical protein
VPDDGCGGGNKDDDDDYYYYYNYYMWPMQSSEFFVMYYLTCSPWFLAHCFVNPCLNSYSVACQIKLHTHKLTYEAESFLKNS